MILGSNLQLSKVEYVKLVISWLLPYISYFVPQKGLQPNIWGKIWVFSNFLSPIQCLVHLLVAHTTRIYAKLKTWNYVCCLSGLLLIAYFWCENTKVWVQLRDSKIRCLVLFLKFKICVVIAYLQSNLHVCTLVVF